MKMIIPAPRDWQRRPGGHETLLVAPEGDLVLAATKLFPAFTEAGEWLRGVLGVKAGAPTRVVYTEEGWKMTLVEPADQPAMAAFVHVLDYAGGLIARCRDEVARPGWRDETLALFHRSRPLFRQEGSACLFHQIQLGVAS